MTIPVLHVAAADILPPGAAVTVVLRPSPLRDARDVFTVPAGLSVAEIVEGFVAPRGCRADWIEVWFEGGPVARALWPRLRLKEGAVLAVIGMPQGKWFRQLALAAVAVIALVAAPYIAAPLLGALGIAGAAAGTAAGVAAAAITAGIGAAITIAGTLAVNALFPAARPESSIAARSPVMAFDPVSGMISSAGAGAGGSGTERSPTYAIGGGRNEARPHGAIPLVLGAHRMSPPLGARTYTETVGDDQYLRMLFVWGYGPMVISDLRIGETPIGNFEGLEIETREAHNAETLRLFPDTVFEEPLSLDMTGRTAWVMRTTAANIDEIVVDVVWQAGVYAFQKSTGNRVAWSSLLYVQHAVAGTNNWQDSGILAVTSDSLSALRRSLRVLVPRGQYDVRLRNNAEAYVGEDTIQEGVTWSALRGVRKELPIKSGAALTITMMRVKASSQLSGTIETFNGVARTRIRSWNGFAWVDGVTSSNPADIFRHVLQCSANARPVSDAELDLPSIQLWHSYCAARGFTFNQVRDFTASVFDTLRDVASAGRASVSMRDGRWGVIWDQGASQPVVQHFTPRNSSEFEGVRAYADLPDAFRVRFINANNGWLQDERIVYDDGQSAATATTFEALDFPGVTDPSLVWRHARYHLAQLRLRRETYSLTTDFEGLICQRGDRVRVQHDVAGWGQGSGRVRAVDAAAQRLTLDEPVTMEAGQRYTLRCRLADGASLVREIVAQAGSFATITLTGSGALPAEGDLVMFGTLNRESVILRVLSIEPQRDLRARLFLVDDAPGIATADQGVIPPFDSALPPQLDYFALPPRGLTAVDDIDASQLPPRSRLNLGWTAPASGQVAVYLVEHRTAGGDWRRASVSGSQTETSLLDLSPGAHDIRIRALFVGGQVSRWAELNAVRVALLFDPPPRVEGFAVQSLGALALLTWQAATSAAVSHYRVKFSPATAGAQWQAAAVLFDRVSGESVQTAAQPGTYLIKAVTWLGRESEEASVLVTTIAPLEALNVVETRAEHPAFAGAATPSIQKIGGEIRLVSTDDVFAAVDAFAGGDVFYAASGVAQSGVYDFADMIDLGEVYAARLSSEIEALGENITIDVFAPADVFDPDDVFGADASQWDVTIEVSSTRDDPAGAPAWSAWTPLTLGDVTARAFRFRAVLASYQPAVTPRVSGLRITVDMPDRTVGGNDVVVPAAGLAIAFTPPFRRLEGFGVAPQGMLASDRYEITAKSEAGFTIRFFDASNAGVSRTFDYVAKGYGAVQ